jgi:hypothetical protein
MHAHPALQGRKKERKKEEGKKYFSKQADR